MTVTGGKHVLAYYVSCVGVRPRAVACAAHTHSLRRVRVRGVREELRRVRACAQCGARHRVCAVSVRAHRCRHTDRSPTADTPGGGRCDLCVSLSRARV